MQQFLQSILDDPSFEAETGLCTLLTDNNFYADLIDLFATWPEFSGEYEYPVSDPHMCPRDAYHSSTDTEKWSPDNAYGAARRRLIAHIIKELKKCSV